MREIKFRGIREKTGEWVYGYLVIREEPFLHDIVSPIGNQSSCTWAIKRGSEGQYTGLKDKNGVEIYEGDIIGLDGFWSYCIDFHDGAFRKIPCNQAQKLNWPWNPLEKVTIEVHGWKVVGNRYENPELLKEEPTC